jgi:hypothetical protein
MDLPNYGLTTDDEEEEREILGELCYNIMDLFEAEIKQQKKGDHSHSKLKRIDEILAHYMKSDSILLTTAALRYSWQAHNVLKNWHPLLEIALKKWPDNKNVFCGLTDL